ncbi:MAG: HEAT repeat domain-containing protein [Pirellulaceae bacterium]|nr:HEAT repeat domain-containing protein [Pirellulaceae bacterium]
MSLPMRYQRMTSATCFILLWSVVANPAFSQRVAEKSIEELIVQLSEKDGQDRRDAVYELVRRGDTSREVIDAYLVASNDKDVQVRIQSLTGLARAGSAAESAVSSLLKRMDDRDNQVRLRAADALGKIGSAAIEPLLEKWPSGSIAFKIASCHALKTMGPSASPAVPVLRAAIGRGDAEPGRERPANRSRQREGSRENRGEPTLAAHAAAALVAIDPENAELLLAIAENLDVETRMVGISALAALSDPSPRVIDRLKLAANDEAPQIREVALILLAKANIPIAEKEPLLEAALLDSASSVRSAANIGMRRARLGGREFAERLAIRLQTADLASSVSLLEALAAVGPAARVGLDRILDSVQRFGVEELANVDGQQSPAANTELADNAPLPENKIPRELVVSVFANMGPEAAVDLLTAVSGRPELEPIVSEALTRIGQPAVEALLVGMLDSNPSIRMASIRAVGSMKTLTEKSFEQLIAASTDANAEMRKTSVAALASFVEENDGARLAIVRAIADESAMVRAVAIGALGDGGFAREQRREGFRRGLNDNSEEVRIAALTAISKTVGQMQRHAESILELASAPEKRVRLAALKAMAFVPKEVVEAGQFGSKDLVKLVVNRSLKDDSIPVRMTATGLVPIFELYSDENSEALTENLSGPKELVVATLEVLPKFSVESVTLVEKLQSLLAHESSEVRIAAVTALTTVDRDPGRLTESLLPLLNDPEWVVRRIAGPALGRQGSVSVSAVPKLFELLGRHEDKDYAGEALRQIDTAPEEMMPLLIEHIDSSDRRKAFYAVVLLGKLGPVAGAAIPKLEALLASDSQGGTPLDDFRRNTIKEALAKIKPVSDQ